MVNIRHLVIFQKQISSLFKYLKNNVLFYLNTKVNEDKCDQNPITVNMLICLTLITQGRLLSVEKRL